VSATLVRDEGKGGVNPVALVAVVILGRWLLGLRASYLYYASLHHTNVFWTPFSAQLLLFLIGLESDRADCRSCQVCNER